MIFVTRNQKCSSLNEIGKHIINKIPEVQGVVQNINKQKGNVILGNSFIKLIGKSYLMEEMLGLKFKVSAGSFFQVNTPQAENLYNEVLKLGDFDNSHTIVDAYCGIGVLSIFLATGEKRAKITKNVKKVIGVEIVADAIQDARYNAKINNVQNIEFIQGACENIIRNLPPFDGIILDPPRKGCDQTLLEIIIQRKVNKIVYISCDPATLARDIALLLQNSYTLCHIKAVDMFPQTSHIESIAILKKLLPNPTRPA